VDVDAGGDGVDRVVAAVAEMAGVEVVGSASARTTFSVA